MLFNSIFFILCFLPLVLIGWYSFNHYKLHTLAKVFLFGMSLWFYAYFNPFYVIILLVSLSVNYIISYMFQLYHIQKHRKYLLFLGLFFNLGMLGYYKYTDFLISNINVCLKTDLPLINIILPLGISFFTFIQLSFIIDRYKEEALHYALVDYLCFVSFFPQLTAGPIVAHTELIPQFQNLSSFKFQPDLFIKGCFRFTIGLGKKVLLADILAKPVNYGFSIEKLYYIDSPSALMVMLLFALELYFDFSAYSDMALGIGNMLGITLPENFNSPYKSCSVSEFWRNWHITLYRFLQKYIYFPLGGSRKGKTRQYRNILIVFLVSGLWHGANWTFIIWGLLQGVAILWENIKPFKIKHKFVSWICTFSFTVLSFSIFRSDNLTQAKMLFQKLFSFTNTGFIREIAGTLQLPENYIFQKLLEQKAPAYLPIMYLLTLLVLLIISFIVIAGQQTIVIVSREKYTNLYVWSMAILFVWSLISLSQVSTFLYFKF